MNAKKLEYAQPDPRFFPRGAQCYCYVRPRYSCGSPSQVHDHIALGVARDEKRSYDFIMQGHEGEAAKKRAELLGLRGTAYIMAEKGSGKNFRWLIQDLVTGEFFRRHHDTEIERLGFTRYSQLPVAAKAFINKTGRDGDYDRSFWKYDPAWRDAGKQWVAYEPELVDPTP